MTELELSKLVGKKIIVLCKDGETVQGFCSDFIKALDNEPEIPSIFLETNTGLVEIILPDIENTTEVN